MEWAVIAQCISIFGLCITILVSLSNLRKGNKQTDESRGKEMGIMLTRMESIQSGIDEIKERIGRHDDSLTKLIHDVAILETRVSNLEGGKKE